MLEGWGQSKNSLVITFVVVAVLAASLSFVSTQYLRRAQVQQSQFIPVNGPVWEKNGDVYRAFVPVPAAPPAWLEVAVKPTTVVFTMWRACFQGDERTDKRESLEWVYGYPVGWRTDCNGNRSYMRDVIREMENEYTRFLPEEAKRVLENIGKFRRT